LQVVHVCAEHKKPAKLLKHLAAIKAAAAGLRNPPRVLVFANKIKVRVTYHMLHKQHHSCGVFTCLMALGWLLLCAACKLSSTLYTWSCLPAVPHCCWCRVVIACSRCCSSTTLHGEGYRVAMLPYIVVTCC
jgi:hypothetical protein